VTSDHTGTHSYATSHHDSEIMLHVSTELPYVAGDTQQVGAIRTHTHTNRRTWTHSIARSSHHAHLPPNPPTPTSPVVGLAVCRLCHFDFRLVASGTLATTLCASSSKSQARNLSTQHDSTRVFSAFLLLCARCRHPQPMMVIVLVLVIVLQVPVQEEGDVALLLRLCDRMSSRPLARLCTPRP
jgi:hypothetical protein